MAVYFVALLILVTSFVSGLQSESHAQATASIGGPHGTAFDDLPYVNALSGHHRLTSVTIGPCYGGPLTYLKFEFGVPGDTSVPVKTVKHGTLAKGKKTELLTLEKGEFITKVSVAPIKAKVVLWYRSRVGAITFHTSKKQSISCGTYEEGKTPVDWEAGEKRAFLYFSGAQGEVIDNLTGYTIPIEDY